MKRLLQINPVIRTNTSTGRIMQEIGELAMQNGWESYVAYSGGRDGMLPSKSNLVPIGGRLSVAWHGIMTRLFDRHGLESKRSTKAFIRKIEEIKPDVIHIHNIHGYFLNYKLLFEYLAQSPIPVVWTIHDCWLFTGHCYHYASANCYRWQTECGNCPQKNAFPKSWMVDRSKKNFRDKKAAFTSLKKGQLTLVTVSDWMKEEMRDSFLSEIPIKVIHNGINMDVFHPRDCQNIKEKLNLDGKRIILGVASIWSKEKGINDFIQMASLLNPDELIMLVGIDSETQKQLPGNVVAISRTENASQLAEIYSAADVFVNPTWQDNYPTVNMEALACGTPVVTYRTGGSVEVITPATGQVVEQGDVPGLLDAVRCFFEKDREILRERCYDYARHHFPKEERYKDYFCLYEDLIDASRTNA